MAKKKVLIPIIHRTERKNWDGQIVPAALLVPHYAFGLEAGEGETLDLSPVGFRGVRWPDTPTCHTDWCQNPTWSGTLSILGYHGGRSSSCYAVRITLDTEVLVEGLMSCAHLHICGLLNKLDNGRVAGTFRAIKRGTNYMIEAMC